MMGAGDERGDGFPAVLSDPRRLEALARSGQYGSDPEEVFDDLTRVALSVSRCQIGAITFVGETVTKWKSVPHLPYGGADKWQNGVGESLCYLAVAANAPVIIDDAAVDPRTIGHPAVEGWGVGAWAGFPIVTSDGHAIGTMCVIDTKPRQWEPDDLEAVATLARAVANEINLRTSLAAARSVVADLERQLITSGELARSLQETLLPPLLPVVSGVEVSARYVPATGDVDVVGDFYDLFHARGSWWSAVVGDVCGKGVDAAKVTSLARYTLRADARELLSPAATLSRLNDALLLQNAPRYLTAVQVTFRPTTTGLAGRVCLAGHPPALVRRRDGRVQQVGKFGTLLGVFDDVELTDVRVRLNAGDLLLLYTDGACEARPNPAQPAPQRPMFDEDALAAALRATHGMDADSTNSSIHQALADHHDGWHSDDTALLALRVATGR